MKNLKITLVSGIQSDMFVYCENKINLISDNGLFMINRRVYI